MRTPCILSYQVALQDSPSHSSPETRRFAFRFVIRLLVSEFPRVTSARMLPLKSSPPIGYFLQAVVQAPCEVDNCISRDLQGKIIRSALTVQ